MSDTFSPWLNSPNNQPPPQAAGVTDVVTQLQGIVRQLTALVQAINGRAIFGTFTMPAAATATITQPGVKATSVVILTPTNASAATLMGASTSLYYTITAGASFTVSTASGANAAGTETFSYVVQTPT